MEGNERERKSHVLIPSPNGCKCQDLEQGPKHVSLSSHPSWAQQEGARWKKDHSVWTFVIVQFKNDLDIIGIFHELLADPVFLKVTLCIAFTKQLQHDGLLITLHYAHLNHKINIFPIVKLIMVYTI